MALNCHAGAKFGFSKRARSISAATVVDIADNDNERGTCRVKSNGIVPTQIGGASRAAFRVSAIS